MSEKSGLSQDQIAVEQWLKRKPQYSFARRIPEPEALYEPIPILLIQALMPGECLQMMIELPSQGILKQRRRTSRLWKIWHMWELTPGWLVALTNHRLLLIRTNSPDRKARITAIPVEDIFYLEQGMILLFSWLEIHWIDGGVTREETLYYDSTSEEVVMPLIQMLRHSIARCGAFDSGSMDKSQPDDQHDREILQRLQPRLPLKFLNMIPRYGLLAGEHICQAVFRPAQWRSLLGLAPIMISPRLVILTTNAYLLLAAEDRSSTKVNYGLILTFLPVQFVQSIQAGRNGKGCSLSIRLEDGQAARDWSIPFPLEMEGAVRAFTRTC